MDAFSLRWAIELLVLPPGGPLLLALLGLALGPGEGGLLGRELGWELDQSDGSLLGVELGRDEGGLLGREVGWVVGRDDGSLLGVTLGRDVGNVLGMIEGEVLGVFGELLDDLWGVGGERGGGGGRQLQDLSKVLWDLGADEELCVEWFGFLGPVGDDLTEDAIKRAMNSHASGLKLGGELLGQVEPVVDAFAELGGRRYVAPGFFEVLRGVEELLGELFELLFVLPAVSALDDEIRVGGVEGVKLVELHDQRSDEGPGLLLFSGLDAVALIPPWYLEADGLRKESAEARAGLYL